MNGMNVRGKNLYESSYMRWDRVPTHIPHVFIEHIKLNGRSVLILNDELGGFDMDTYSDDARYTDHRRGLPHCEDQGVEGWGVHRNRLQGAGQDQLVGALASAPLECRCGPGL